MNWKELQQMAKEFDREARKERQDAGEHRADAVGLLTPALLRTSSWLTAEKGRRFPTP